MIKYDQDELYILVDFLEDRFQDTKDELDDPRTGRHEVISSLNDDIEKYKAAIKIIKSLIKE